MTDKAPLSDFDFGPGSQELTPFDVSALLQEYADGRRKFNQIDLKNGNLSHAHLPYIQLEESLLQKADLRQAILAGASLNHIDLSSANLSRINLIAADLIRAKLAGSNLTGAFLSGANLSGANLRKSNLTDCTLAGANLSGVDFSGAILKNTNMAGATLRGANLSAVDLSGIDLAELNLEGSILPAEHTGAAWTALRPGQTPEDHDAPTQPDPSLGTPAEAHTLDAFDGSYDELIQDLAEAANWSEGLYADYVDTGASEALTAPDEPVDAPYSPQSPFGPVASSQSPEPVPGTWEPEADDSPEELVSPFNGSFDLTNDHDYGPSDTLALIPLDGDAGTGFEAQLSDLDPGQGSPFTAPPEEPQPPLPLGPAADSEGDHSPLADGADSLPSASNSFEAPETSWEQGLEPIPEPPSDYATETGFQPLPEVDEEDATAETRLLPEDDSTATANTTMLPKERQELRQTHHQEEVIKTIQSALNRRTHYSLRRKLLEIYNKRCALTDCNILPLLDTVLIDSRHTVADHPSNGLVLRKDIKILYNLYLIAINPADYRVMLSPSLRSSSYGYLEGHKIRLPKQTIYHPDRQYLQAHLDQCKWLAYGDEAFADMDHLTGAGEGVNGEGFKSDPLQGIGLLTKVALALGGVVVGSLLTSLVWTYLPLPSVVNRPEPAPDNPQVVTGDEGSAPEVLVPPEDQVGLQLGPLVYPLGGVIVNDSAYLSVPQLRQAGLVDSLDTPADVVRNNGQQFVQADYVRSLGLDIGWDAETRTVSLNCCEIPEIEPITIAISGQDIAAEGLIIEGNSYVPVEVFEVLNIAPVKVPGEFFVGLDQSFYVKANGLKAIGIDAIWNAETRTLDLVQS